MSIAKPSDLALILVRPGEISGSRPWICLPEARKMTISQTGDPEIEPMNNPTLNSAD